MAGLSALPLPTQPSILSAWHHCLAAGCLRGTCWAAGCRGPRPPRASRGQERHPCPSGRWGDRAGRRPPTSSLCPGSPQHLLGSVSLHLAGPWAAPAQGSVGSCYSVPNPTGHRAIYLDVGPAPPLTSPTLSTSGKAALYAHLPPLYLPQGFSAASWVPRDR